jgi:hypothetical protein
VVVLGGAGEALAPPPALPQAAAAKAMSGTAAVLARTVTDLLRITAGSFGVGGRCSSVDRTTPISNPAILVVVPREGG